MEATITFKNALREVYRTRSHKTDEDRRLVGRVLAHPIMVNREGRRFDVMRRTHLRVREIYLRDRSQSSGITIDLDSWIQWIKDHWLQILQAISAILSILILI